MPTIDPAASPTCLDTLEAILCQDLPDLDKLRQGFELAIRVEFSTIPAYLSALYSIKDTRSAAYQALRSVVIEEMFHVNQACNLLIGVGGRPKLTGSAVPVYPNYLPGASQAATSPLPFVGLNRASREVFQNVFMAIETPAPWDAPAQGAKFDTIGQVYKALRDLLEECVNEYGTDTVFQVAEGVEPRTDIYLGKFGGNVIEVTDMKTADAAIRQIVEQGEGAVDPTNAMVPTQPNGTYEYYGNRTDGTYGPILGTPYELSHFYKFMDVANAPTFPDTWPTMSNPRIANFSNDTAKAIAEAFNTTYSVMLKTLEASFHKIGRADSVYFKVALPLMHHQLPALALALMVTPAFDNGDFSVGPNAAPTFEWVEGASFRDMIRQLKEVEDKVAGALGNAGIDLSLRVPATPGQDPRHSMVQHAEALHAIAIEMGVDA